MLRKLDDLKALSSRAAFHIFDIDGELFVCESQYLKIPQPNEIPKTPIDVETKEIKPIGRIELDVSGEKIYVKAFANTIYGKRENLAIVDFYFLSTAKTPILKEIFLNLRGNLLDNLILAK